MLGETTVKDGRGYGVARHANSITADRENHSSVMVSIASQAR